MGEKDISTIKIPVELSEETIHQYSSDKNINNIGVTDCFYLSQANMATSIS